MASNSMNSSVRKVWEQQETIAQLRQENADLREQITQLEQEAALPVICEACGEIFQDMVVCRTCIAKGFSM